MTGRLQKCSTGNRSPASDPQWRRWLELAFLTANLAGSSLPAAQAEPVSFRRQIAPILQAKCLGCHSAEKAKGGYRVHTFTAAFQAGKSKSPAITPAKPEESEVFKRITSDDPDERMPQKDEPLTSAQVEIFRSWIGAGATLDEGADSNAPLAALLPKSPHPAPPERYRRPQPIIALRFTPDGQQLAVSGYHEVTFWDLSGQLARRLTNVPQRVRSLAFHPGAKFLAVAGGKPGRSGELSIYDVETNQQETNLLQTADEILAVAFNNSGNLLACAGTDNAIHIFNWETRARLTTIQQHADWVTSISFDSAGGRIASASRDRTARLYDAASGNLEVTYTAQNAPLNVIAFLPDDKMASGGRDKTLHLWDVKEGKKRNEIGGFAGEINAVVIADGAVFSAGADGLLKQHSVADRKEMRVFKGHGDAVYSLAYDGHSKRLASGSYDGVVNVWNTATGALENTFVAAPGWSSTR